MNLCVPHAFSLNWELNPVENTLSFQWQAKEELCLGSRAYYFVSSSMALCGF